MSNPKHGVRRLSLCALLGIVVGVACGGMGWGRQIEEGLIDLRMRHAVLNGASDEVILVGISDADLANFGSWPFPRGVHGDVLQILNALEPAQVTVDILFTEPSEEPEQDKRLQAALDTHEHLTLAYYFDELGFERTTENKALPHFITGRHYGYDPASGSLPEGASPIPPFTQLSCSFGAANGIPANAEGVIRHAPLFIRYADRLYPGLAMQTVISALNIEPDQITVEPGNAVTLANTSRGTLRLPLDNNGLYRTRYGAQLQQFSGLDYSDLYRAVQDPAYGESLRELIAGKIVLVGYVATGSYDVLPTPIGQMPGLVVHANIVSNLLTNAPLWLAPTWLHIVLPIAFSLLAAGLMRYRRRINFILVLSFGALLLGVAWFAGSRAVMLPTWPLLCIWCILLFASTLLHPLPVLVRKNQSPHRTNAPTTTPSPQRAEATNVLVDQPTVTIAQAPLPHTTPIVLEGEETIAFTNQPPPPPNDPDD